MIFTESALPGAYLIDLSRHEDERGFFARSYCAEEFAAQGLRSEFRQCSVSYNAARGTLRGLHYQAAPHEEEKLVRCTAGAIFDVIVDIRAGSATRHRWLGIELTARNRRAVFVPKGFAHGFISLTVGSEVLYMISEPLAPSVISARDAHYPSLDASPAA